MNASEPGTGGVAQASPGEQDSLARTGRHRVGPDGRLQPAGLVAVQAEPAHGGPEMFTRSVLGYAATRPGQPIAVLLAGFATAGDTLDVGQLRADGCEVIISPVGPRSGAGPALGSPVPTRPCEQVPRRGYA